MSKFHVLATLIDQRSVSSAFLGFVGRALESLSPQLSNARPTKIVACFVRNLEFKIPATWWTCKSTPLTLTNRPKLGFPATLAGKISRTRGPLELVECAFESPGVDLSNALTSRYVRQTLKFCGTHLSITRISWDFQDLLDGTFSRGA